MDVNKIQKMKAIDFLNKIADNSIDLIVIDPPYVGVINESWDRENQMTLPLIEELYRVLKPSGSLYVWCGIGERSQSLIQFIVTFRESKFYFKDLLTWKKQRGIGMRKGWLYTREEIIWYVKDNKKFIWNKEEQYSEEKRPFSIKKKGGEMVNKSEYKRLTNVWTDINEVGFGSSPQKFHEIRTEIGHRTPKPVQAIERIISLHTQEGDTVLDCFAGSGSTLQACERLNRNFLGCDIGGE